MLRLFKNSLHHDFNMDPVHFNDDHRLMRDQIERFIETEVAPNADEWEIDGKVPRETLRKLGELGLLGVRVPEKYGGSGMNSIASVVMAESLARCTYGGFTVTVAVHTDMASPHLVNAGSEAQCERYLPGVVSGETITSIAVTEPDAGSDVQGLRTTAVRDGNGWRLNGRKVFITNGVHSNLLIVAARTDKSVKPSQGMSMFLLERDTPGLSVTRQLDKVGWRCSDTAELELDDIFLPADALLGEENRGFYGIMKNFQNERLVAAAICSGEASKAIELTLEYVRLRQAFGGTLWDKQAIRQRLAMHAAKVEALRQFVYHTAWLDSQGIDCVKEVSMAKAWGAELANKVMYDCQQFHGGFGYMSESTISRMVRDIRVHSIGGGATEVMLEEVAKRL